jgi:hypothetical protein
MRPKWIQVTHRSRPCCPCSRPVRRTEPSLRGALATKQSSFCETTRKKLDCFAALAMTVLLQKYLRPRRANAPEVCHELSRHWNQRARGMPDARCIRGPVCKMGSDDAHEHTGSAEASDIPCAMALRLTPRSCVRKICQNVRTGGSQQPPVAGSEPVRARRPLEPAGERGTDPVSSSTRTVAWA